MSIVANPPTWLKRTSIVAAFLAIPHVAHAYDEYVPRTDGSAADRLSPELLVGRPINAMRDDPYHLHQLGNALPQADLVPPGG